MNDAFGRWMHPDPALRPPVGVMADELDVLLEPEREVQRRLARRELRQKIVQRATFAAIIVLACLGGLFAYSNRKTLRLASELDAARAEGAASFDKLDTCVASHQLAQREAQSCREAKAKAQADFRTSLDRIAKTGGANEAAMSRQMQGLEATYTARIRACEDEVGNAARQREQERERLSNDWHRRQTELTSERDEQSRLAETRAGELERCRVEFESQARMLQAERAAATPRAATVPAAAPIVPPPSLGAPAPGEPTAPTGSSFPPLPAAPN
jgi:hypothetical protein